MKTKIYSRKKCPICGRRMSIFSYHSARPLRKGRCCSYCWGMLVIPARTLVNDVDSKVQMQFLLEDMRAKVEEGAKNAQKGRSK